MYPAPDLGPHENSPNFPPNLGGEGSDAHGCVSTVKSMELLSIKDLAARWSVSAKRARTIVAALSFPQAIYLTERTWQLLFHFIGQQLLSQ